MNDQPSLEDIARWLRLVVQPGMVIELRILGVVENPKYPPFTVAGYFDHDHLPAFARTATEWTAKAEGVYTTINPVVPDLLARANNRVIKKPKHTTTDSDIVRRIGLVFDADPKRAAGVSATKAEKALARERIDALVAFLTRRGWPAPILADSGNGYHARYAIDLANNEGARELVERVLKAAAALFSDEKVAIDTSLSNASRVIKLYGTMARKGDDVFARPHRWSRVLEAPDPLEVVPVELLERLAGEHQPAAPQPDPNGRPAHGSFTATAGTGASPEARARAYVFAPGFPDSVAGERGHDRLYHVASVLVDGFGLSYSQALPIFADWNRDKAKPPESDQQVQHKLSDAIKDHPKPSLDKLNAPLPGASGGSPSGSPAAARPAPSGSRRGGTASPDKLELATTLASEVRPEPVDFLDGGVIPRGKLITLAGLGGAGKGMLWANMVADLTRGRRTLGLDYEPPAPVEVLLVGCEDGYKDTVIPRLLAAGADLGRVHILDGVKDEHGKIRPFSLAYLQELETYLTAHPEIALVIIDPIAGYIGRAGVKDHHDAEVRSLLEPLGELANRRATTVICTKHLNKDEAKTLANRVGGSVAYVNVPRACFVVAADPENPERRILASFKWNLNASRAPAIAWTMEPPPPDEAATILAAPNCSHLNDTDKAKLAGQLNRLVWAGAVEFDADDLLRTTAKVEQKQTQNEIDRATAWLRDRLAQGPVGSIRCARAGDQAIGRKWPVARDGEPPGEHHRRVLGRVKWWRTILKDRLGGSAQKAGYQGAWFFRLPEHAWPPPEAAIETAAKEAKEAEQATVEEQAPLKDSLSEPEAKVASKESPDPTATSLASLAPLDSLNGQASPKESKEAQLPCVDNDLGVGLSLQSVAGASPKLVVGAPAGVVTPELRTAPVHHKPARMAKLAVEPGPPCDPPVDPPGETPTDPAPSGVPAREPARPTGPDGWGPRDYRLGHRWLSWHLSEGAS
jgi:hypothetical protein